MEAADTTKHPEQADQVTADEMPATRPPTDVGSWPLFLRTLSYVRPYLGSLATVVLFSILYALGRNGRAFLLKPLLDDAIPNADPALFAKLSVLGVGIIVVSPIAVFGLGYLTELILGKVMFDIRTSLAAKLLRLPLSRHRAVSSGETLTRTMVDAAAAMRVSEMLFSRLMPAGVSILGGIGTMLFLSWKLTLLSLLAMPLMASILIFFAERVRLRATRQQEQLAEVTRRLSRILSGIKAIKAFRGEETEETAFSKAASRFLTRRMKMVKQAMLSRSLVELVNTATVLGVIFGGGFLVIQGTWDLTIGGLGAFVVAAAMAYQPIKSVSKGWTGLMESLASAERFFEILDEEEEPEDRPTARLADRLSTAIEFDRVSFSYGGGPHVLQDVSFRAERGEVVGVVGPTGSGKTTLADLLVRFHDPDSGAIRVDGVDLRDLQRQSFLDQIAVVTQEPFLFDTTIRENIRYGRPDADDEAFEAAVRMAHVDDFVRNLPNGYETEVLEGGMSLSGGQRQLITIARAILKDPSILVLDEATSSLDAKAEQIVQDALDSLQGRRTVFVIAHRLSTIRSADRILVLDRGRVAAQGSHAELMGQPGLYRELVELQAKPAVSV